MGPIDLAATGEVITLESAAPSIAVWNDGRADRIIIPREMFQLHNTSCAISPTGAAAVIVRDIRLEGAMTVFDLAARRVVGSFALSGPGPGFTGNPGEIVFAPDGRTLAVGTGRGLFLADVAAAKVVRALPSFGPFRPSGIVFTPDGRAVVYRGLKEMVLV
jgi:hypothetical protein